MSADYSPNSSSIVFYPRPPSSSGNWADDDEDDWNYENWKAEVGDKLSKRIKETLEPEQKYDLPVRPLRNWEDDEDDDEWDLETWKASVSDALKRTTITTESVEEQEVESDDGPTLEKSPYHAAASSRAVVMYDPETGVFQYADEDDDDDDTKNTSENDVVCSDYVNRDADIPVSILPGDNKSLYLSSEPSKWPWPQDAPRPSIEMKAMSERLAAPAYPELNGGRHRHYRSSYTFNFKQMKLSIYGRYNKKDTGAYLGSSLRTVEVVEYNKATSTVENNYSVKVVPAPLDIIGVPENEPFEEDVNTCQVGDGDEDSLNEVDLEASKPIPISTELIDILLYTNAGPSGAEIEVIDEALRQETEPEDNINNCKEARKDDTKDLSILDYNSTHGKLSSFIKVHNNYANEQVPHSKDNPLAEIPTSNLPVTPKAGNITEASAQADAMVPTKEVDLWLPGLPRISISTAIKIGITATAVAIGATVFFRRRR